jgi:hypothetical protein
MSCADLVKHSPFSIKSLLQALIQLKKIRLSKFPARRVDSRSGRD